MRDVKHGRKFNILCFQIRLFLIAFFCSGFSVAISIIVLPTVIILYGLYMLAYLYLKIRYGNTISRANGLDIMYSLDYSGSNSYLNAILTFDGEVTIEDIKNRCRNYMSPNMIQQSQCIYRRIWQKMEIHFGYTFFRDDPNFDIDEHMITATKEDLFGMDEPEEYFQKINAYQGEDAYGEFIRQEMQIVCQRLLEIYGNKKIPVSKPQWEIILYKHPGENRCTIIFHGHHCISDGISLVRYFLESFGDEKVEYTLPYTFHQDSWIKRCGVNLFSFCMLPFGIWRLTYQRGNTPLHGPELSGEKIFIRSKYYSTKKMKDIKNKCSVTMLTLLCNSLAYALRCNYKRKGANIRKSIALIPVPHQNFNKPPFFENNHGLQGLLLRTDILDREKDCALYRLNETEKLLYISVRDPSFLPIQWIMMNIGPILPRKLLKDVFKLKGFTTCFSNLNGPLVENFTICNGKGICKECMFWLVDRNPMGMGLSSGAYLGRCSFALSVDKALIKSYREGYIFLEDFIQEFENLRKELNLNNDNE